MKKYIAIFALVGVLSVPSLGHAQVVNTDINSLQQTLLQTLETLVAQLTAQLKVLIAQQGAGEASVPALAEAPVNATPTDDQIKEAKLKELDAQILPLLDTSIDPYLNNNCVSIEDILAKYKLIDKDFNLTWSCSGGPSNMVNYELKTDKENLLKKIQDYIEYR